MRNLRELTLSMQFKALDTVIRFNAGEVMHVLKRMNWALLLLLGSLVSACSNGPTTTATNKDVRVLEGSGKGVVYFEASVEPRGALVVNAETA